MRKVILIAVGTLLMCSAQAQFKPAAGTFGVELQFRPLGNVVIETSSLNLGIRNVFGISPRLFVTDKIELKADLLLGTANTKDEDTLNRGQGLVTQTTKTSAFGFGLNLGINYHFKGTERISPYVGASLGFGIGKASTKITNLMFVTDDYSKAKAGAFQFGFDVVTGFNWYIVNGLYLGAEVGLGLAFAKPMKSVNETKVGPTVTTTTVTPTNSAIEFGFAANPAIRLGWRF